MSQKSHGFIQLQNITNKCHKSNTQLLQNLPRIGSRDFPHIFQREDQ